MIKSTSAKPGSTHIERLILLLIMALALILRLVGITWGLPNIHRTVSWYPDEKQWINAIACFEPSKMNFNPRPGRGNFNNPSFLDYTIAASLLAAGGLGQVELVQSREFYWTHPDELAKVYLVGRSTMVLWAVLSVLAAYVLGRKMYGERHWWSGLLAALLFAVMPGSVHWAHIIIPDLPVVLWVVLSLAFLIDVAERGRPRDYVLSGLMIGVASATKYNAMPLIILLPLAHFLRRRHCGLWRDLWSRQGIGMILSGWAVALLSFLLITPYAILDFEGFWHDFRSLGTGVIVYSSTNWTFLRSVLLDTIRATSGWVTTLGGIIGLAVWILKSKRTTGEILVLVWIALMVPMTFLSPWFAPSRAMVVMAVFVFPAVGLVAWLSEKSQSVKQATRCRKPPFYMWAAIATVILMVGWETFDSVIIDLSFVTDTVRAEASHWIQDNTPAGTVIGLMGQPATRDSPDIVFMDYWHNKLTGGLHKYRVCDFDVSKLCSDPTDVFILPVGKYLLRFSASASNMSFVKQVKKTYAQEIRFGPTIELWPYRNFALAEFFLTIGIYQRPKEPACHF